MRIIRNIIFFVGCTLFQNKGQTQTPFISQNFNNIQFFNPASVGFGSYNRFSSIYRSQFTNVGRPYKTIGLNLDFGFLKNDGADMNNIGFGIQGFSEQLLDGILQTNSLTATIADRVFFDDLRTTYLALGIGSTFVNRTVDYSSLIFGDQFTSGRLLNATSMEVFNNNFSKNTINVGFLFSRNNYTSFFQLGASSYFINRSTGYNTINDSVRVSPLNEFSQVLGQLNYEQIFSGNKTLMIHANYQSRYENDFVYAGAALGIPFNETYESTNRMYFGCFYRTKDAVVPYIGLLLNKYKLGITYDIYNNDMTSANLRPQTFEFTLSTYFGKRRNEGMRSLFD
ncbi:MAG: PorP/SprF family type IX secretion system membrane protein [Sediminibacterium sp.]|jgi:type IX secretion system PorP/SprF family membrane protein|nr:PorP/SprF family type IX secretion system membrane protein [Sediminibacterium sp.]